MKTYHDVPLQHNRATDPTNYGFFIDGQDGIAPGKGNYSGLYSIEIVQIPVEAFSAKPDPDTTKKINPDSMSLSQ
ncbi:MAG: hypothetical protein HQL83_10895 [Magnetococcales bacterium]|nr:hypothetical protein [Magnetococcales bacterium]MBF0630655.1 hypothetical protein [Magnetococcales bacterium]